MKKKASATFATFALLSIAYSSSASASELYTVQKGDTLSGISVKANTSVADLMKLNKLASDKIFLNQKITLPGPGIKAPAQTKPAAAPSQAKAKTYTVVKGDSLSAISVKTGVPIGDLKTLNGLKNDMIYIGQVLKLQAASTVAAKPAVPAKPAAPVKPADTAKAPVKPAQPGKAPAKPAEPVKVPPTQQEKPTVPAQPATGSLGSYVVVSGDTLGKISLQFNTTVENLKALNGLATDMIRVGQTLKVPALAETPQPASPAENSGITPAVISIGKNLIGSPYVWGGSTIEGFDCSGFIYYVYNQAGNQLVRHSAEGYYNRSYEVDKPVAGDLVFFENTYKKGISHMGIYLGDNFFLHADAVIGVTITSLDDPYYKARFESFKRFY
ncbi:peptidoglycan endopeptidase [Neobacillus piezotolerans]|uniref:Peptidoglycan endopeptidase n=1 Tax=Neobacillus piezotolerans TaxID=2259171 RepID=A0A3D8GSW0_9BACI|nr:peptidoglycan endopeptidase [Neobacillus piezotolerans]RDU37545.1 peptidoglycan endopeptidase [Neobacillus piezotolerans]